jgi:ketosteroid isomerase-like protein
MSRWLFISLIVVSSGPGTFAQMAEQEVLKVEQVRLEARRKADSATLARLSSDDLLIVGPAGQLIYKKGASALPAVPKIAARDVKTQMFGDVAVITGVQAGVGASGDQEQRFTRVWRKQDGQWLLLFAQVTRVAAPAPATTATPPRTPQLAPTQWPAAKSQDERDVLKTQRALNESFARKDSAAYALLTADSFVRINPNGNLSSRPEFLKAVAATPDVKRVESNNSDIRLRFYGPIAIMTYIDKTPTGPPAGARMTRVFTNQDGAWKQLVTQSTAIEPLP